MRKWLPVVLVLSMGLAPVVAGGLIERIDDASAAERGWVGWRIETKAAWDMCCGPVHGGNQRGGHCSLADGNNNWRQHDDDGHADDAVGTAWVWVRADDGEIDRIKVISDDCDLDTSGVRAVTLDDVEPGQSVRLLAGLLDAGARRTREDALTAIAVHADSSADVVLERRLAEGDDEMRTKAAFWLAAARGSRGSEAVIAQFRQESDADVRRELVFALYVAERDSADDELIRAARRDPSAEVRKQALFWIAQRAGDRAVGTLTEALTGDPQSDVRQHAVFAISQLPPERGVPLLIDLAEDHGDAEVRRQAIFWLGQSDDPRATEFLISLLD